MRHARAERFQFPPPAASGVALSGTAAGLLSAASRSARLIVPRSCGRRRIPGPSAAGPAERHTPQRPCMPAPCSTSRSRSGTPLIYGCRRSPITPRALRLRLRVHRRLRDQVQETVVRPDDPIVVIEMSSAPRCTTWSATTMHGACEQGGSSGTSRRSRARSPRSAVSASPASRSGRAGRPTTSWPAASRSTSIALRFITRSSSTRSVAILRKPMPHGFPACGACSVGSARIRRRHGAVDRHEAPMPSPSSAAFRRRSRRACRLRATPGRRDQESPRLRRGWRLARHRAPMPVAHVHHDERSSACRRRRQRGRSNCLPGDVPGAR